MRNRGIVLYTDRDGAAAVHMPGEGGETLGRDSLALFVRLGDRDNSANFHLLPIVASRRAVALRLSTRRSEPVVHLPSNAR